jgi:hypothetical protein
MMDAETTETPREAPSSKKAKWRGLDDIVKVRLALAAVIRKVYDGDLEERRGSVCVTGLKALGELIYSADIERRLRDVEERLRGSAS